MNNINIVKEAKETNYRISDLFKVKEIDQVYMLSCVGKNAYVLISINDGGRWANPCETIFEATRHEKLEFLGRDAEITITFKKKA